MDSLSNGKITYTPTPIEKGLTKCIDEFVKSGCVYDYVNILSEAYLDKISHTPAKLSMFDGWKPKVKYLIGRYTPYILYNKTVNK